MSNSATAILTELQALADSERAAVSRSFFKTGKGQYGEGDEFLGIRVPDLRRLARTHRQTSLDDVAQLLASPYHEARLVGLLIMVYAFEKAADAGRTSIFNCYLQNLARINNWDLVDLSAPNIVGEYLGPGRHALLARLAKSERLWDRRIAILATFAFIRRGYYDETLRIAKLLLHDGHDLIHKAVGWMLREVGKRDYRREEAFLKQYAAVMPRTMLRYAVERFPPANREAFMTMQSS